jgi:hypothetical protein
MQIKVETDKRINIYAIWSDKQIILCKEHKRSSHFHNKDWIVLWPSTNRENRMLKKEIPIQSTDFLLSQKGYEYLKTIIDKKQVMKNCYIAEVEYVEINGNKEILWENLRDKNEFVLWDIHSGPLKYFKSKLKHYLAFYRVYKLPEDIFPDIISDNIVKNKNGKMPGHNSKKLTENISGNIINSVNKFVPIMDDNEYNRRKQQIINIIKGKPGGRIPPLPGPSKEEFENAINKLNEKGLKSNDAEIKTLRRTEQDYLRNQLFEGKKYFECGICGNRYPVSFLVAAHIKKRSECTFEEQNDKSIVMPMCNFGCDELYEKGYISVKEGSVIQIKEEPMTPLIQDYIDTIEGKNCEYWNESTYKYFNWHSENSKKEGKGLYVQ